jgi:hypothetical protein
MTEPVSLAEQREQLFLRDLERESTPDCFGARTMTLSLPCATLPTSPSSAGRASRRRRCGHRRARCPGLEG